MKDLKNVLDSITYHDTLNPKVWDNYKNTNKSTLKKPIRNKLVDIANEFIGSLSDDDNIFIDDIVLLGSLTNYNWSEYSDFDLHIMVDLSQFDDQSDLYKKIFDLKKDKFNTTHDIKIVGFDVELYVQSIDEDNESSGIYSLIDDEWISKPDRENPIIDKKMLKRKALGWIDKINNAIESSNDVNPLKKLKDKLKTYRKSGLEKEGEFSYENLVFKILRRTGHIEKLINAINTTFDKKFSMDI